LQGQRRWGIEQRKTRRKIKDKARAKREEKERARAKKIEKIAAVSFVDPRYRIGVHFPCGMK
jgi:hypothetical protein